MNKNKVKGYCQVEGCNKLARYSIGLRDGKMTWLYVCEYHEEMIGRENFRRAGGRYEVSAPIQ